MIRDAQTNLWEAAALTVTAVSTNCYDTGIPGVTPGDPTGISGAIANDIGTGEPLALILTVGVAADHTTGDETYEFGVITATATDLTTGQIVLVTRVISYALLTAGAIIQIPIPSGSVTQRFVGAKATLGGTTPTITVTCWIDTMSKMQKSSEYYATAVRIS